jgi:hypothetical protein
MTTTTYAPIAEAHRRAAYYGDMARAAERDGRMTAAATWRLHAAAAAATAARWRAEVTA